MKLKVKKIDISTGVTPIIILNKDDALKYDIHLSDRLFVAYGKKEIIAAVDISDSDRTVPKGKVAVLEEVSDYLKLKDNVSVELNPAEKPISIKYIKKKLEGEELNKHEIETVVKDIVRGAITDIELTYFVSGCYTAGMSLKEILALIDALSKTGSFLKLNDKQILELHCIGGIAGNRTTMIVVPIIAAFGLKIPKTSSRAITSPAGTADTMEVLANVSLNLKKMQQVVEKTNGCIAWGGSVNLAPADDKIIRIEHPLGIDAMGLMLSSVMAKQYSVFATHLLIDIPIGQRAKLKNMSQAIKVKKLFKKICRKLGIKVKVIITDGSQPVGNGIGPLLECLDVLKVLKNETDAPRDLKEKSIMLAGKLLELSGKVGSGSGIKIAGEILESGKAYNKMMEIVNEQGKKKMVPLAKYCFEIRSERNGKVKYIDNKDISRIAIFCGAPKTKEAGVYLHKKVKDKVKIGEILATLYSNNKNMLEYAKKNYFESKPVMVK